MRTDESTEENLALREVMHSIFEECRMVLPGIQALFGFQLIAVFSQPFSSIGFAEKTVHGLSVFLTIIAIGCLMAPAAYHRQVEQSRVSQRFVIYASRLLCIGMLPLALSLTLEIYVVFYQLFALREFAVAAAALVGTFLIGLWYLQPFITNLRRSRSFK